MDDLIDKLSSAADAMSTFTDSLKDFLEGLWTDDDTSPLNTSGRYAEAQKRFRDAVADLRSSDDTTRTEAQDNIRDLAETYLAASKSANANWSDYYADFMAGLGFAGVQYGWENWGIWVCN